MITIVDWKPTVEERDLILEGLQILWDEADNKERAAAILSLRLDLQGAPEVMR